MLSRIYFILCVLVFYVESKNEEYMGYKVYNVKFNTKEQQDKFDELKSDLIDFWRNPSLKYDVVGRAMVPPSHFKWFEDKLEELDIDRDIHIEDVYEYLNDSEKKSVRTARNDVDKEFSFDEYHDFEVILNHLRALEETFADSPTITVTLENFDVTEQERSLVYLKIGSRSTTDDVEKPVVIIEAGSNAREWITIPSALYIVNRLLDNPEQFLERSDWIVIPVLNPDGYEFTRTSSRLWQKSRSTTSNGNLGIICPGVNINRNFDVAWGLANSSLTACSPLFPGNQPFSEIEAQMVQYLLQEYGRRTKMYVSLHNTEGFISYPWNYEWAASGMFIQHLALAKDMVAVMNDLYQKFDSGSYLHGDRASGTSTDYAQQSGILYSFNVDVAPNGDDGVLIPDQIIVYVVQEIWRAIELAAETLL